MSANPCADCHLAALGLGGRGAHLVIPSMIAPILAFILVANRIYWRMRMLGRLGLDDMSTILALIFLVIQCSASIAAVNYGYGRPFDLINKRQAAQALKYFFLLQIFYKLTINCTKLSILFLYLRIFTDRPWFVRTCWSLVTFVVGACISFTIATILQCNPISRAWERWASDGSCVDIYALWYSNAIYNILTDFLLVLMVPPVIFRLKLPVRQKLALTCIFGLGVIVCAASISRLTTLYSSAYGNDITAGSLVSTIWTTIEAGLGVLCANLPMVRTPLQHFFPKLFPPRTGTDHISSTVPSQRSGPVNGEALASPARLIPPQVPVRKTSLPSQTRVNGIPDTRGVFRQKSLRGEVAKLHSTSRLAHFQDIETQGGYSDGSSRPHIGMERRGEVDWYGEQHQIWSPWRA
ncbi:hypothetical protein AYL99_08074 [Fonsecaea erecta]|uniref:Rhodopsin domain-containing protein n=1 Tax=Fonsecaea erecta TaxID=1367422 RepID=A0A178ZCY5_9EURO|nr:hypothetical protein AYL99_08074 [Fonsecaea erecta]OAP57336.1 hypothetical protein AYL99_08074 [Fonsecaea erecta]